MDSPSTSMMKAPAKEGGKRGGGGWREGGVGGGRERARVREREREREREQGVRSRARTTPQNADKTRTEPLLIDHELEWVVL